MRRNEEKNETSKSVYEAFYEALYESNDDQTELEKRRKAEQERLITHNEFYGQMMPLNSRCTNALWSAKRALLWNALNTVLILIIFYLMR